jgi:mRNA interferase MazF
VLLHPPEGGLTKPSVVPLNQIRSIDKQRLIKRLGVPHQTTMKKINIALQISLGLIEV